MKANGWAAIALSVCCTSAACAQDVFLARGGNLAQNEAPTIDPEPVTERHERSDEVPAPAGALPAVQESAPLDELTASVNGRRVERKWRIIPFGRIKVTADDNLFISSTAPESDVYFTLSPGIAAGWGDYTAAVRQLGEFEHYFEVPDLEARSERQSFAFAKYVANASIFTEHTGEDALDHDAVVSGRWEWTKLTLGGQLFYRSLSGTDVDVGDRVFREVYGGAVNASYGFSEKTSAELNLLNSSTNYEAQNDFQEWTVEDWLNYQIRPKTSISIGSRLGTLDVDGSPTQTFEQLVGRIAYLTGSKLGFNLDGGLEWRQFGSGGKDDIFTVFNFAAIYQPFDGTSLSANAFRRNTASASLEGENITATGVAARVRQRFLHRFYVTLEGGYQNSTYRSNLTGEDSGRQDDGVYVKPTVSFDVTKYLSAESSYQYQRNDSSTAASGFSANRVTFQINLQF